MNRSALRPSALLAVLVGGAIGSTLRLGIDQLGLHEIGTLTVNTVGAFVLGLLTSRLWPTAPGWARAGLGAGLLGSFTTFSAVVVSTVTLPTGLALANLAATLVLGLLAALLGLRLGSRERRAG